jgi:pilus assembly protein CpaD
MATKQNPKADTGWGVMPYLLWLLALPLAACSGPDRIVTGSVIPDDYRQRHPVVLAEAPQTLDIFVSGANGGGSLDLRSYADVRSFAGRYKARGHGQITILFPRGTEDDAAVRAALPSIRRALVEGGARGSINVGDYRITDPALAAPVRLSFVGLKAAVASQCGQWPSDLASGSTMQGWENKPYWNFGCATQTTLTAQVDDPRDLVGPRTETPSDVQLRTRAIEAMRNGKDPSTAWSLMNTTIGNVGGGN